MYTKKYSPEESLEKIKLFMKYDSKKTLNENKLIVEQVDISGDIRDIKDEIDKFNSDEDLLIKIIEKYTKKEDFKKLLDAFKEKYATELGTSLYLAINSQDKKESQQLIDHLAKLGITAKRQPMTDKSGKWQWAFDFGDATPKSDTNKSKADSSKIKIQIPEDLKDVNGVKAFQDWLDQNVTGWAKGYKDGKVNKGQQNPGFKSGGYGSFGPRTSAAWATYKNQYLNKQAQSPAQDEIGAEEIEINVDEL